MVSRSWSLRCLLAASAAMALAGVIVGPGAWAGGGWQLSAMVLEFNAQNPRRVETTATNNGPEPLYLEVRTFLVRNSGLPDEERVPITDPRQGGLLATPTRLVLAPGASQAIRFMLLEPLGEVERVYRAEVVPVMKEATSNVTAVRIVVAYGTLMLARPLVERPALEVQRTGTKLTARNSGNMMVEVRSVTQCVGDPPCREVKGNRVYVGQTWSVDLPLDAPVVLQAAAGERYWEEKVP
jgi:P pilus assembly chaperone PapD